MILFGGSTQSWKKSYLIFRFNIHFNMNFSIKVHQSHHQYATITFQNVSAFPGIPPYKKRNKHYSFKILVHIFVKLFFIQWLIVCSSRCWNNSFLHIWKTTYLLLHFMWNFRMTILDPPGSQFLVKTSQDTICDFSNIKFLIKISYIIIFKMYFKEIFGIANSNNKENN